MPRIDDKVLDCVIYLYPSVEHAKAGMEMGGSGFLVGIPSEVHEGYHSLYAVTNSHVIRDNCPVVRLNTKQGDTDPISLNTSDWIHHEEADLAVCPLRLWPGVYKYAYIPLSMFLTEELLREHNIGPGDEVHMVGRFISHQGKQRNTPLARFGNISMMPWEPIPTQCGPAQESFLVEVRSLSGFSGSPVFVDIPPFSARPGKNPGEVDVIQEAAGGPWLLGVDWGHPTLLKPVIQEQIEEQEKKFVRVPGWWVQANSGLATVIPAWRLRQFLDQENLIAARKAADDEIAKMKQSSPVVLDGQAEDT